MPNATRPSALAQSADQALQVARNGLQGHHGRGPRPDSGRRCAHVYGHHSACGELVRELFGEGVLELVAIAGFDEHLDFARTRQGVGEVEFDDVFVILVSFVVIVQLSKLNVAGRCRFAFNNNKKNE
jgi:hypothetical protein